MRAKVVLFVIAAVVVFGSALPILAVTNDFAFTISASDPTFHRFSSSCAYSASLNYHFTTALVEVSQPGNYSLYDTGNFDGDPATIDAYVGFFFAGSFDPNSSAGCVDSGDDISTITFPAAGQYTMVITTYSSGATGPVTFSLTGPGTIALVAPPTESSLAVINDGRINNWDIAAPVVLYGRANADGLGLVGYSPTENGSTLFEVTAAQIAAVPACPAENTLITQNGAIALYRQTSCEFHLVAPSLDGSKTYHVIFSSLAPGAMSESFEG